MSPAVERGGLVDGAPGRDAVIGFDGSGNARRRGRRRGRGGGGERTMVPDAEFTSYYGRPIVKPAPWEHDIPAYLFSGGLAAGSSLLAAGADLNDLPALRRAGRFGALAALGFSMVALVHDLGRPARFVNMLRTVKLTSPMSVGTWILSIYGPFAGAAGAAEAVGLLPDRKVRGPLKLLRLAGRPAGLMAGLTAPPVAAYTAVLLADTATPSWHAAYKELPFVFVSSALAASGGLGMVTAPVDQAGPARRMAVGGAVVELLAEQQMERSMGITAEPLHKGQAGKLMKAAKVLTAAGAAGSLFAGRSRALSILSGAALMAGSACTRFGVFEAGQESARDPKYTVVPQRERLDRGEPVRYPG
ncbi:MAG TPA: NrfD/PsrC family molybdoenzyme membrane anchor subunit [Nocardioidaceae bacterium]|nr:NrfD/PsrC family molybdoenzyme membrane anchor subunit [Nocardioidaceae bacterium]